MIRLSEPDRGTEPCLATNPPTPDYSSNPADIGFGTKNRFMTFVISDPGPPATDPCD